MSSKTFLDIYNSMDKTLIPPEKYYSAHRLEDELELLEDHSDLCSNYFLHIVDKLGLESILNNIIIDYFGQDQLLKIKQIVIYGIYYHDIGKINHNFQMNRVNGQKIKGNTNHSYFSHRILTAFLLKKFPDLKEIISPHSSTNLSDLIKKLFC